VREKGSGTREILARSLALDGLSIEAFPHFLEVGNMHSLLSLLRRNCGVSFLYRIAAEEGLQDGSLQEIHLPGFPLRHDFDFLWEKTSIYSARYRALGEELSRCRQK
jgi:DNA-binding transcriptional LysR family regulator